MSEIPALGGTYEDDLRAEIRRREHEAMPALVAAARKAGLTSARGAAELSRQVQEARMEIDALVDELRCQGPATSLHAHASGPGGG